VRYVALGAGLLGGIGLVANLFVDRDELGWVGLGLIGVAVAVAGAGLVREAWLKLVCAAGSVALGWSLLEVLHEAAADRTVDAVAGGLTTLCVAVAVVRRPARPEEPARRGNHRS
jgi:hypothetical protein